LATENSLSEDLELARHATGTREELASRNRVARLLRLPAEPERPITIAPARGALVDARTIRILDLVFLAKNATGDVAWSNSTSSTS
jgi:hypothetical protein